MDLGVYGVQTQRVLLLVAEDIYQLSDNAITPFLKMEGNIVKDQKQNMICYAIGIFAQVIFTCSQANRSYRAIFSNIQFGLWPPILGR